MRQFAIPLALAVALVCPASAQVDGAEPATPPGVVLNKSDRPVLTPPADERVPSTSEERRAARLDLMFGRLAKAEDGRRANRIARHIMRRLSQSGSPTVDVLMARAGSAMQAREFAAALDFLDGVVRLQPDFAEGWNRRATVHFLRGDYGRSMADIEQVLKREPRHWGALAGLSMILVSLERNEEAVRVMNRALAIHPHLDEMKERRERLVQELRGSDI